MAAPMSRKSKIKNWQAFIESSQFQDPEAGYPGSEKHFGDDHRNRFPPRSEELRQLLSLVNRVAVNNWPNSGRSPWSLPAHARRLGHGQAASWPARRSVGCPQSLVWRAIPKPNGDQAKQCP